MKSDPKECLYCQNNETLHNLMIEITVFITQFIQIVHMVFIRNKTTSTVGLFLKQKHT